MRRNDSELHINTASYAAVIVRLPSVNADQSITSRQHIYHLNPAVNPEEPECLHFQMLVLSIWILRMQQRGLKQK